MRVVEKKKRALETTDRGKKQVFTLVVRKKSVEVGKCDTYINSFYRGFIGVYQLYIVFDSGTMQQRDLANSYLVKVFYQATFFSGYKN